MAEESRRVELVANGGASRSEGARTGAGLLLGLFVARGSVVAAALGLERFDMAIAHFVGVVLVCVAGSLLVGYVYDRLISQIETNNGPTEEADGIVGDSETHLVR